MAENRDFQGGESLRDRGTFLVQPVPPLLHQIWLQGAPVGEPAVLMAEARRVAVESGWQYFRWSHEELMMFDDYARLVHLCRLVFDRADLGRIVLLHRYGGLYLDADIELRKLPADLRGAWLSSVDGEGARVDNFAMAQPAGHPFGERMLELAADPKWWALKWTGGPIADQARKTAPVNLWFDRDWMPKGARYGSHLYRSGQWGSARLLSDS
jgi:mannosyltransferase OCH1-like enzyme